MPLFTLSTTKKDNGVEENVAKTTTLSVDEPQQQPIKPENRITSLQKQSVPQNKPRPIDNNNKLPEWKQRMIAKNEAAKKEVTDIMDDSMNRVMAKIEQKPEDQRAQAVDGYVSAVDWIMWSVNAVIDRVR